MKVYCLVFNGYSDWEIGYVLPELKKNGVEVITVGLDLGPVESMGGLKVQPHISLSEADQADLLIVPGGERWHDGKLADALSETLLRFHKQNTVLAAICGATITLGRAGLLNDCKHTSNQKDYLQSFSQDKYQGASKYVEELAVSHKKIITASGLGSLEFTVEILKMLEVYPVDKCDEWYAFFKHAKIPSNM